LDTLRIRKLHYVERIDFLSQAAKPMIEIPCPTNPPSNYILDETTMIQHGATRMILEWPPRNCGKRQLEMNTDHLGLKLPNFRTIRDSFESEYDLRLHEQHGFASPNLIQTHGGGSTSRSRDTAGSARENIQELGRSVRKPDTR
jgi:hypothetical protein